MVVDARAVHARLKKRDSEPVSLNGRGRGWFKLTWNALDIRSYVADLKLSGYKAGFGLVSIYESLLCHLALI